jgi:nicotinamidase-related amidase
MGKGKPGWEIHPSIAPSKEDSVVLKNTPSSFYKTNLQEVLSSKGITKLVITGLQTECCIDTTVRHAFCLGYDVILVKDANSTYDIPPLTAPQIIQHHHRIIGNWFAKVVSMDEVEFE